MVSIWRATAACGLAILLVAPSASAQRSQRPSRLGRAMETAERVLEAARAAGVVELPEQTERAFRDVVSSLDIDEAAPIRDEARAWRDYDGAAGRRRERSSVLSFRTAPPVAQFVTYFTKGGGRRSFETGYRRSGLYRALAERIFREEGVPADLVWLAQVESLWKPWAVSSAQAKGLWQFIPSTGARFGLERTYWIDERANPIDATRAAARYLSFLNRSFDGDWLLALAAYNAGEGAVGRAVSRAGRADFWYLYRGGYLPRETRNYVPAILATIQIVRTPRRYGIQATPAAPWRYDTVRVRDQLSMQEAATLCGASLEEVWQHNPDLRRGVTPPGHYDLRIPRGARDRFLARAARN